MLRVVDDDIESPYKILPDILYWTTWKPPVPISYFDIGLLQYVGLMCHKAGLIIIWKEPPPPNFLHNQTISMHVLLNSMCPSLFCGPAQYAHAHAQ